MTPGLYIMDGSAQVEGHAWEKGDTITGEQDEVSTVTLIEDTAQVLFLINLNAEMTFAGIFNGVYFLSK